MEAITSWFKTITVMMIVAGVLIVVANWLQVHYPHGF